MVSHIIKKPSGKKGFAALYPNRPSNKVTSPSQLDEKFEKMHLTSSQSKDLDSPQVKKKYLTRREFYKEHGVKPQLPVVLYDLVKEANEIIDRMDKNDWYTECHLKSVEFDINLMTRYFAKELPRGWKYYRANAKALLI